jgi:hypothetical protein
MQNTKWMAEIQVTQVHDRRRIKFLIYTTGPKNQRVKCGVLTLDAVLKRTIGKLEQLKKLALRERAQLNKTFQYTQFNR